METQPTAVATSPLRPVRVGEQVAQSLGRRIRDGAWQPGERLPNTRELAASFRVSVAAVRQGLTILEQSGLVEVVHGVGTFVRSSLAPLREQGVVSFSDVRDLAQLLELRVGVESEAARLAALRRTAADLAALEQHYAALGAAVASQHLGEREDYEFHRAVARATHNRIYMEFSDYLGQQFQRGIALSRARSLGVVGRPEAVLAEHREVLQAIRAQDADAAWQAMRRHVTETLRRLEEGDEP